MLRQRTKIIGLVLLLGEVHAGALVAQECECENILYVDADATGGNNDGTSWADAYLELRDALDNRSTECEVWVAEATYTPDEGTPDRDRPFQLGTNLALLGGFDGSESSRDDRDWINNVTVLSGDIGTVSDDSDNSYHIFNNVFGGPTGATTVRKQTCNIHVRCVHSPPAYFSSSDAASVNSASVHWPGR